MGRPWRISAARKAFVEKKLVEWGFPATITALGYFLARSVGLYDPATFAVLGPLSTIVASKAVSAYTKGVGSAGSLGTQKLIADIDSSAREREIRKLLQRRDRYLVTDSDAVTVGVPIAGTGTALDGSEYTMPVDMLELMYDYAAAEGERQAESKLTPMRRRELARARFTLDHDHHDSLIDQFKHFRFRPELDTDRAKAVAMVFASEAEAEAARIVTEQVTEMALYDGRDQAIEAVQMRRARADDWATTPEWWRAAKLGPTVRPLMRSVDEPDMQGAPRPDVLAEIAALESLEAETAPESWELS